MSNQTIPTKSPEEALEMLKTFFCNPENPQDETKTIPILWGKPTIGKSYIMQDLAQSLIHPKSKKPAKVIEVFGSNADPTEVKGIPVPDDKDGVVKFMPLEDQIFPNDRYVIWFWDEINRAQPDVIQAFFSIISTYPRKIGVREIPDNVYIVACANEGSQDGTIVTDFDDSSFYSKFAHVKVEFSIADWRNYMENKYIKDNSDVPSKTACERVLEFLDCNSEAMYLSIPENASEVRAFQSPRTIDRFVSCFKTAIADYKAEDNGSRELLECGASLVGLPWITEFSNYLDVNLNRPKGANKKNGAFANINSLFREKIDTEEDGEKLSKKINGLSKKDIITLCKEMESLFNNTAVKNLKTNINSIKFNLFTQLVMALPTDVRKDTVGTFCSIDKFVNLGDELSKTDAKLEETMQKFIEMA